MAGQAHHFLNYAPNMDPPNDLPYAQDRYRNEVGRLYGVLDQRLADRDYVAGDFYSIADMAIWPWANGWKNQQQDIARFPHMKAWLDAGLGATRGAGRAGPRRRQARRTSKTDREAQRILFGQAARADGAPRDRLRSAGDRRAGDAVERRRRKRGQHVADFNPRTGCTQSGATSASGRSTKPRSCSRGCGSTSAGRRLLRLRRRFERDPGRDRRSGRARPGRPRPAGRDRRRAAPSDGRRSRPRSRSIACRTDEQCGRRQSGLERRHAVDEIRPGAGRKRRRAVPRLRATTTTPARLQRGQRRLQRRPRRPRRRGQVRAERNQFHLLHTFAAPDGEWASRRLRRAYKQRRPEATVLARPLLTAISTEDW